MCDCDRRLLNSPNYLQLRELVGVLSDEEQKKGRHTGRRPDNITCRETNCSKERVRSRVENFRVEVGILRCTIKNLDLVWKLSHQEQTITDRRRKLFEIHAEAVVE